jgi:hypothetical protein
MNESGSWGQNEASRRLSSAAAKEKQQREKNK